MQLIVDVKVNVLFGWDTLTRYYLWTKSLIGVLKSVPFAFDQACHLTVAITSFTGSSFQTIAFSIENWLSKIISIRINCFIFLLALAAFHPCFLIFCLPFSFNNKETSLFGCNSNFSTFQFSSWHSILIIHNNITNFTVLKLTLVIWCLFYRASPKLSMGSSPHRKKRLTTEAEGGFSSALAKHPPPIPPPLLRRLGSKEISGLGKVSFCHFLPHINLIIISFPNCNKSFSTFI